MIVNIEQQYIDTANFLLQSGEDVENRTGVTTRRILGITHRWPFSSGFPLLTTKRIWFKGVIHELLWFLSGDTNIKYLIDRGVHIWTEDAYRHYKATHEKEKSPGHVLDIDQFTQSVKNGDRFRIRHGRNQKYGDLGPIYGAQWRRWEKTAITSWEGANGVATTKFDQIEQLIDGLKNNPTSRRHIINAWHVGDVPEMALPPCHVMSQFTISHGKLWCHMYQRSADYFLGVPFNIASYSLLTYMIAQMIGIEPGGFIHTMHDCHVYSTHIDALREQIDREPRKLPQLLLSSGVEKIDDFLHQDIVIEGYNPHPAIKADLVTERNHIA